MESTLKDIKSKTYGIVTDPTYISYSLIGLTTFILGYYVFYDKNSSGISSEETAESATSSEDAVEASAPTEEASAEEAPSPLGGLFGREPTPDVAAAESEPKEGSSSLPTMDNMFGSTEESKEPTEEKTVGGKRKKTRRQRKQNKSAKSKKQSKQSKK